MEAEINDGGWTTVQEVDYTYYTNESYGDVGGLKTVAITTPLTDSGVDNTRKKYYRYWEGTYDSGSNPGYPYALPLSKVITADDPDNTSPVPDTWVWNAKRDSDGMVHVFAMPDNVSAYTHSSGSITNSSSSGLYYEYTRKNSGAQRGFQTERKWKEGVGSLNEYYEMSWVYGQIDLAVDDSDVVRPTLKAVGRYPTETTTWSSTWVPMVPPEQPHSPLNQVRLMRWLASYSK